MIVVCEGIWLVEMCTCGMKDTFVSVSIRCVRKRTTIDFAQVWKIPVIRMMVKI